MGIKIGYGPQYLDFETFDFPGGEVSIKLARDSEFYDRAGGSFTFHARIGRSRDLMLLALARDAVERASREHNPQEVPEFILFMPYVPYARQDRVCAPGEALSLKVLGNFINNLDFDRIVIADPHSDVTAAVLDGAEVISQSRIVSKWVSLRSRIRSSHAYLVSPDAGALKKTFEIAKLWNDQEVVVANKIRNPQTGNITGTSVDIGDFNGHDVVCCDDICDGGRTFTELAKACKAKGAGKFVLYVTHGIFSKGADCLFESGVDEIWTTNSYRESYDPRVYVFNLENL